MGVDGVDDDGGGGHGADGSVVRRLRETLIRISSPIGTNTAAGAPNRNAADWLNRRRPIAAPLYSVTDWVQLIVAEPENHGCSFLLRLPFAEPPDRPRAARPTVRASPCSGATKQVVERRLLVDSSRTGLPFQRQCSLKLPVVEPWMVCPSNVVNA